MDEARIISVIEMYEAKLQKAHVPKVQMSKNKTFRSASEPELLAHAHYLCEGVKQYAKNPAQQRKAGSHLTAVQMCLSFAGWYTLGDLMEHNRPPEPFISEKPRQGSDFGVENRFS